MLTFQPTSDKNGMLTFQPTSDKNGIMTSNCKKNLTFEDFWEKHQYTFPGFANGAQIAEICKDIARDAWGEATRSSPLDKAESPLDKAESPLDKAESPLDSN